MSFPSLTGKSARGAALHGLLLGLALQALLVGAIELAGQPVRTEVAGVYGPSPAEAGDLVALAEPRP